MTDDEIPTLFNMEEPESELKPWQRSRVLYPVPEEVTADEAATIQERFEQFHRLNPWVYDSLVELVRDYRRRGYPAIGIGHLVEILRWLRRGKTYDPTADFKLSNDYRSRYSRLIMAQEPDLDGFITTRSLRTE